MISILLASHGRFAEGLLDAVSMIIGEADEVVAMGLFPGDDINAFNEDVVKKCLEMGVEDGVLVLSDLFGASPCKASIMCLKPEVREKIKFVAVTGMNLPMALEAVTSRSYMDLDELTDHIVNAGKEGVRNLNAEFAGLL